MIWNLLKQKAQEEQIPLTTVVGEALHVTILDALSSLAESGGASFQGGTCLHLVHGGYRYSEDLDFAGTALTKEQAHKLMRKAASLIEKQTVQILGTGTHSWRFPDLSKVRKVYTSWYTFRPAQQQQRFRVKIEMAQFPVYFPKPFAVRSDVDVTHRMPLVSALPPRELLAEKITAIAGRKYLKGRDLFDLWYLTAVLNEPIDLELLKLKFRDYRVTATAKKVMQKVRQYSTTALENEMKRFLPVRYRRTVGENGYELIRRHAERVLENAELANNQLSSL